MICSNKDTHDHWVNDGWPCPLCQAKEHRVAAEASMDRDRQDVANKVVDALEARFNIERDVIRRLTRLEMRNTLALRHLGLIPGRDEERDLPAPGATVATDPYRIVVDRVDIPLRDIARAAAIAGLTQPTPIYYNGDKWGMYYPK